MFVPACGLHAHHPCEEREHVSRCRERVRPGKKGLRLTPKITRCAEKKRNSGSLRLRLGRLQPAGTGRASSHQPPGGCRATVLLVVVVFFFSPPRHRAWVLPYLHPRPPSAVARPAGVGTVSSPKSQLSISWRPRRSRLWPPWTWAATGDPRARVQPARFGTHRVSESLRISTPRNLMSESATLQRFGLRKAFCS